MFLNNLIWHIEFITDECEYNQKDIWEQQKQDSPNAGIFLIRLVLPDFQIPPFVMIISIQNNPYNRIGKQKKWSRINVCNCPINQGYI